MLEPHSLGADVVSTGRTSASVHLKEHDMSNASSLPASGSVLHGAGKIRTSKIGTRSPGLAVGLFLLAPLVAEFLLGNLPITALYALVLLAPLYGGGALLIREVARRSGGGWPSILVLALAYGVLEEGITTMSLFNPNYAGERLLDHGYVPFLGMGATWTVFVLTLHTVWSISVPIAIIEVLAGARRTTPWLGNPGLAVSSVLFAVGIAATTALNISTYQFVLSIPQLFGVLLTIGLLTVGSFAFRPPRFVDTALENRAAPSPWLVGVGALVLSTMFKQSPRDGTAWLYCAGVLLLAAGTLSLVYAWSQQLGWSDRHRLALAGGALFTYAWTAFPQTPMLPAAPTQDLIGNAVFAAGALVLVGIAARKARRSRLEERVEASA